MALRRAGLQARYNKEYRRYKRARDKLVEKVGSALHDYSEQYEIRPIVGLESSVKEFDSFCEKARELERQGEVKSIDDCFEKIKDIARARIVCQTVEDAQRIRALLKSMEDFLFLDANVQDHNPAPKTGYRAIHLDLEIDAQVGKSSVATPCELQIVTALQHAWGLYTHRDFYKGKDVPPLVATLMRELSDLLHVADRFAGHLIGEVSQQPAKTRSRAGRGAAGPRTTSAR